MIEYPTLNCQDPKSGILSGSIKKIATKKDVKNTNQKVGINSFKNIVMLFDTLLKSLGQVVLVSKSEY